MIEVVKFKVRAKGKRYVQGETIDFLSEQEEERLIALGFAKRVEGAPSNEGISDMNVDEVKQLVDTIKTVESLQDLLEEEQQGKKRKSLVKFIEGRIQEYLAAGDND